MQNGDDAIVPMQNGDDAILPMQNGDDAIVPMHIGDDAIVPIHNGDDAIVPMQNGGDFNVPMQNGGIDHNVPMQNGGDDHNVPEEFMNLDDFHWVKELVDDTVMMEHYKVGDCPYVPHNPQGCGHVHPGERRRRSYRHFYYRPEMCPAIPNCPNGDQCDLAHSIHEYCLHPLRFCYSQCCFGLECKRERCHFAHFPAQLLDLAHWLQPYPFYPPPHPPWSPPPPPPPPPLPRPSRSY